MRSIRHSEGAEDPEEVEIALVTCDVLPMDGEDHDVCRIPHRERDANARLIAAAPELLDALSLAEATILRLANTPARLGSVQGTLDVLRAALGKAGAK